MTWHALRRGTRLGLLDIALFSRFRLLLCRCLGPLLTRLDLLHAADRFLAARRPARLRKRCCLLAICICGGVHTGNVSLARGIERVWQDALKLIFGRSGIC